MAKSKEVIPFVTEFPMISSDNSSVLEAMANNLESEEISKREMFTVIPNPKGGEEEWVIKTPMGKMTFDILEGIILHIGNERTYYKEAYGVGEIQPPICSSANGVIGVGEPGGKCVKCEYSQFGPNNEKPICDQKKPMYLLIPEINPVLPVVLNVTGPSFPSLKTFNISLMQFGVNVFDVKVELSLKAGKTKNKMPSSILQIETLSNIRINDPENYAKLVEYRKSLLQFIDPSYKQTEKIIKESSAT